VIKTILAFVAIVLVAAISAIGQAVMVSQPAPPPKVEAPKEKVAEAQKPKPSIHRLPPIIANLKLPEGMWVRLDAVIITAEMEPKDALPLIDHVAQDTLNFIQTLSLNDLEGSQSLSNVRQDLFERSQIRSNGRVKEFIVTSMVVQ